MTHIYPSGGNLSGRWTLPEVVFNIKNSGWIEFSGLDAFNSGSPCTQNFTACNPTVGPVVVDASTDALLCHSQSVYEGVQTIVPHPSGDPVPSPLTALIPKTGRSFLKLYPNGKPASGKLDPCPCNKTSVLDGGSDNAHTLATKDVSVWKPEIDIVCGSGNVTGVNYPINKFPTSSCFRYVQEYSGLYTFIEPTVQYSPSGWIFSHNIADTGLLVSYHATDRGETASPTLSNITNVARLNLANSGEIQFRWRRVYEDWTISETQIFLNGNFTVAGLTGCAGNVESGNSASGILFFQNTLGGSATVSGMTYTQRPNCADGTVEYYYEGVVPYDHPIWSNVTIDTAYTNALTAAGKYWTLKMIHAYSSGHWFAPDGTPSFFEPVGSNTQWNTYIPLHCNDVNSVPNYPFEYTDLHDNADLGARGNDDILYTANTNCSNLSLDAVTAGSPGSSQGGKTTYLNTNSSGIVLGFQNPMPTNLYRQKQLVTLVEYDPNAVWSAGRCLGATTSGCVPSGSVFSAPTGMSTILTGNTYYYNSHIDTSKQLNTGGTWVDHEFCYKMAGRCNIDNVIQVGSCGICAGLSYTAYCYGVGTHHGDADGDGISDFSEWASVSPTVYLEITQALSDFPTASAVPSGVGSAYTDGDTESGGTGYEWPDGTFIYGMSSDPSSAGNYCNESIGGEQQTFVRPYAVDLGTSSVYGENISKAGPQSCLKRAKELWEAAGSPSGARYDIAWYSANGYSDLPIHYDNGPIQETGVYPPTAPPFLYGDNRPGSMGGAAYKPFGEYYYTTSSCHAAIQKVHQYDSNQKLLSRDYGEYGWEDYPNFTGPLPVPHSASSDAEKGHVTVTPNVRSALYGQAWVQWYPHLLGLDARNYGGNRSDDAISGLPPEDICDVLDLIHETDNEKGCSELESIYGSGVVWTSGAYDAIDCGGSPPWDCGDGGFTKKCPDIPRICSTGSLNVPVEIGLNFTVSCREVDTSFYSLSPTEDIKFETLSTYSPSCNTAGLNLLSINSVNSYATDLTEEEWGVTIDIDRPYSSNEGIEAYNNDFPGKTTFSLWYAAQRWGNRAVPVISGVWYDASAAGVNDRYLITRQPSADALRDWTCRNLRFASKTGTGASSVLSFSWPFNDLYFGYCSGTDIPINLVPC